MSVPLPPLEAYRRDVERRSTQEPFGDADGSWVVLATALWQQAYRPPRGPVDVGDAPSASGGGRRAGGAPHETLLWRVLDRGWIERDVDATAAEVLGVAAAIEDAGALLLAQAVLAALARLTASRASALTCGRALAQRARVERQLGHFDVAEDLYTDAGRLGAGAGIPDLQVRSDLGRGVLARIRGNYPQARRLFRRGLRRAERAGLRELTGIAHEGLMVAATVANDLDAALAHGWAAFAHAAGNPVAEADVLQKLAGVCLRAGELEAALRGFLVAAERCAPRLRAYAWADAAHVAALLGRSDLLARCTAACERALVTGGLPYERAQNLLTLAAAWSVCGPSERAERYRHDGLQLAWTHRFTELLLRADAPTPVGATRAVVGAPPGPEGLATRGRRVVRALSALPAESWDDALAGV